MRFSRPPHQVVTVAHPESKVVVDLEGQIGAIVERQTLVEKEVSVLKDRTSILETSLGKIDNQVKGLEVVLEKGLKELRGHSDRVFQIAFGLALFFLILLLFS